MAKLTCVWLCAPTITFSSTVSRGNRARFWNVRATPSPAMPWAGHGQQVVAVELEPAAGRFVDPRDDVEQRRLAGAVRADQPADLALVDRERQGRRARRRRRSAPRRRARRAVRKCSPCSMLAPRTRRTTSQDRSTGWWPVTPGERARCSVPEVLELERDAEVGGLERGHHRLQVVALLARHPHRVALGLARHALRRLRLDQLVDLAGLVGGDADLDRGHLADGVLASPPRRRRTRGPSARRRA